MGKISLLAVKKFCGLYGGKCDCKHSPPKESLNETKGKRESK